MHNLKMLNNILSTIVHTRVQICFRSKGYPILLYDVRICVFYTKARQQSNLIQALRSRLMKSHLAEAVHPFEAHVERLENKMIGMSGI